MAVSAALWGAGAQVQTRLSSLGQPGPTPLTRVLCCWFLESQSGALAERRHPDVGEEIQPGLPGSGLQLRVAGARPAGRRTRGRGRPADALPFRAPRGVGRESSRKVPGSICLGRRHGGGLARPWGVARLSGGNGTRRQRASGGRFQPPTQYRGVYSAARNCHASVEARREGELAPQGHEGTEAAPCDMHRLMRKAV